MTKNDFFRYCRLLHGWLSAFAFVALCFFSFTGLLLNHPEWFSGAPASVVKDRFTLTEEEIKQLRAATESAHALVAFATKRMALTGQLSEDEADGSVVGNEVFARTRGVRGTSFLRADLRSGAVEVIVENAATLPILNELHRAERAGKSWRVVVDAIAVVLMTTSLIGYVIFLGMSGTRLRTAVALTVGSTIAFYLIFVYAVS